MKARIVYLTMALVLVFSLAAVAAPVVGPGISPVQAANTVLDGRTWNYWNDPGGDGCHEGGLDCALVKVDDEHGGTMLKWTFDGSAGIAVTTTCLNGASWFDLILPLDGESWSKLERLSSNLNTFDNGKCCTRTVVPGP